MDTKLIEDFEKELAAHSAALEKAADLCEAQAARIKELEAENSEAADLVGRAKMAESSMRADRDHWKAQCLRMFDLPKILEERNQLADLLRESESQREAAGEKCPECGFPHHPINPDHIVCDQCVDELSGAAVSESQREAAGTADEKPDCQAENS